LSDLLDIDKLPKIISELIELSKYLKKNEEGLIIDKFIIELWKTFPNFCNTEQQDCHEFLLILFNNFSNSMLKIEKKLDYSIANIIFNGELENTIACINCNQIYKKIENFYDLSLNLKSESNFKTLNECLKKYYCFKFLVI
jgi:uncharacterized UBP type Zn finger protein